MKKRNYLFSLILLVAVFFMVSCNESDDANIDIAPKSLTQRLKTTLNAAKAANSSTSSDDNTSYDSDYGDDCMDEFDCFEFVFPLIVIQTNGTQVAITDSDTLFDFFENQEDTYVPEFVYPITLDFGDGEQELMYDEQDLEEAFDLCEDQFECFDIVFPITMVDDAGNEVIINNEEGFYTFFDAQNDAYEPEVIYPIDVLVDDETITIISDDEMEELYETCDGDWDDVMCFDMVYPFDMITEGVTTTITDENVFFDYIDNLNEEQEVDFIYPFEVTDGETNQTITITNLGQFEALYDACEDGWDYED